MTVLNPESETHLSQLLVCPNCRTDLVEAPKQLKCTQCEEVFQIIDDIPRFIDLKTGDLDDEDPIQNRQKYELEYQTPELARAYNAAFVNNPRDIKRMQSEFKILNSFLSQVEDCETMLDIPCGGGRLSQPLATKTKHLFEMDASIEQIKLATKVKSENTTRHFASANGLTLPLPDNSVDGTLSARLSHHMPAPEEREQLLTELLRVSRKFLIFSFTDPFSTKMFFRKIAGRPIKMATMTVSQIQEIAAKNNATVKDVRSVFLLGSRHRYALIVKNS